MVALSQRSPRRPPFFYTLAAMCVVFWAILAWTWELFWPRLWFDSATRPALGETQRCRAVQCVRLMLVADAQIQGYANEPLGPLGYVTRHDADSYLSEAYKYIKNRERPDVVAFLGDLLDEGSLASTTETQFQEYALRFLKLFPSSDAQSIFVPGDNDIGGEGSEPLTHAKAASFELQFGKTDGMRRLGKVTLIWVGEEVMPSS